MISVDAQRNFARANGFSFKKQCRRYDLYKRPGSTLRLYLPRSVSNEDAARVRFIQAGVDPEEVEAFIAQYGSPGNDRPSNRKRSKKR